MTQERWLILGTGVLGAGAAFVAAGTGVAGLPAVVPFVAGAISAMCAAGLAMLNSWTAAAPKA